MTNAIEVKLICGAKLNFDLLRLRSLSLSLQAALAPLIQIAVSKCRMAEICGREKPTVIT